LLSAARETQFHLCLVGASLVGSRWAHTMCWRL